MTLDSTGSTFLYFSFTHRSESSFEFHLQQREVGWQWELPPLSLYTGNFIHCTCMPQKWQQGRVRWDKALHQRMNSFISSQFNYCLLVWVFSKRAANAKLNHPFERALRLACKGSELKLEKLIEI